MLPQRLLTLRGSARPPVGRGRNKEEAEAGGVARGLEGRGARRQGSPRQRLPAWSAAWDGVVALSTKGWGGDDAVSL